MHCHVHAQIKVNDGCTENKRLSICVKVVVDRVKYRRSLLHGALEEKQRSKKVGKRREKNCISTFANKKAAVLRGAHV